LKTITEIVKEVESGIKGRVANTIGDERIDNVEVLLECVLKAGGGNHLEIGTLFGGSAIAVALLKREYEQSGMVFCIDPLNGYYGKDRPDISDVPVSVETLFDNIGEFYLGNRISVIKSISSPVYENLVDIKFSTAYIDGEHSNNVPYLDWNGLKALVTKYVVFDNCADTHPDVQFACNMANKDFDWKEVYNSGISYVVKRV